MASILALAGSNSSTSINFKLVKFTTSLISGHELELLNMANITLPMFSEDRETQLGFPEALEKLKQKFENADAVILSVNEHNSGPSAYFKNVLDWLSRANRNYLENTQVFLMSASPGKRGGLGAKEYVMGSLPRVGGTITATFSLPSFHANFNEEKGIIEDSLSKEHAKALESFISEL
ncbi:MAG: NAD(P)H-dependent oxidoreductase [Maribacter sp.]|nr:NAD(P)H-dependent oxidoreductase [Maribacter sp.]